MLLNSTPFAVIFELKEPLKHSSHELLCHSTTKRADAEQLEQIRYRGGDDFTTTSTWREKFQLLASLLLNEQKCGTAVLSSFVAPSTDEEVSSERCRAIHSCATAEFAETTVRVQAMGKWTYVPVITSSERQLACDGGGGEDDVYRGFSI